MGENLPVFKKVKTGVLANKAVNIRDFIIGR